MQQINIDILFKEKYERYSQMLFRIALLQLGSAHDAEDALQNVFMKLIYHAPVLKDAEHEKAWLIRVTQNQCKNMLKASVRRNTCQLSDEMVFGKTEDFTAAMDISRKVKALPVNYKTAIFLYYYEDLSVEQISKILRISQSAVKMRLKRGRELLKTELEEYRYG